MTAVTNHAAPTLLGAIAPPATVFAILVSIRVDPRWVTRMGWGSRLPWRWCSWIKGGALCGHPTRFITRKSS
ncbi:hypothetical protein PF003_g40412 [Phytophthora fragariae]|nr:hypothetical protein PF003_g40412 [Phytophthora fragariae]